MIEEVPFEIDGHKFIVSHHLNDKTLFFTSAFLFLSSLPYEL